jgi:hypothetical protein
MITLDDIQQIICKQVISPNCIPHPDFPIYRKRWSIPGLKHGLMYVTLLYIDSWAITCNRAHYPKDVVLVNNIDEPYLLVYPAVGDIVTGIRVSDATIKYVTELKHSYGDWMNETYGISQRAEASETCEACTEPSEII